MPIPIAEPAGPEAPSRDRAGERRRTRGPLYELKNTSDPEKMVFHARRLFAIASRARDALTDQWSRYYDWARGYQWDEAVRRPSWRSKAQSNYIFANIAAKTSLVTDARPNLRALPRTEKQIELLKEINAQLGYLWELQGMDAKHMETMAGTLILGTYFQKPYWDPSLKDGLGEVATCLRDPAFIFPDPGAVTVNGEGSGEFIFDVQPMSLEQIGRLWPEKAHLVRAETIPYDFFTRRNIRRWYQTPVDRKPNILRSIPIVGGMFGAGANRRTEIDDQGVDIERALVFELCLKDDRVREVEVEDEDEDGNKKKKIQAVYPYGRHIVYAGDVLLTDPEEELPEMYEGRFPLVRYRDYLWPDEFWGGGEVEQTLEIQREMNYQRARISDHMNYFTNGQWVASKRSGLTVDTITNRPNSVVFVNDIGQIRRETGLPLPSGMTDYLRLLQRDHENISGDPGLVSQGRLPERVVSGKAIDEVQEAQQNRIRLTERLAKESLKELADFWIAISAAHYDETRSARIIGESANDISFLKIGKKALQSKFDYDAAVGSQLLKGQKRLSVSDALALHAKGLIDEVAALEAIDFPQAQAVLARIQGRKEEILHLAQSDPEFASALQQALAVELQGGNGNGNGAGAGTDPSLLMAGGR